MEIDFHNPQEINRTNKEISVTVESAEDFTGKFVVVLYDGKPFVGQVLQVVGDELEVNCMHQSGAGKNAFVRHRTKYFTSNLM